MSSKVLLTFYGRIQSTTQINPLLIKVNSWSSIWKYNKKKPRKKTKKKERMTQIQWYDYNTTQATKFFQDTWTEYSNYKNISQSD
jgi:hypothetical protein